MSLITRMVKQTAVYWPVAVDADETGRRILGEPVEIKCRWEDVQTEVVGPDGNKFLSRSTVYVLIDTSVGGYLWLGKLADVPFPLQADINPGACDIKQKAKLPNMRATEFLRTVYL